MERIHNACCSLFSPTQMERFIIFSSLFCHCCTLQRTCLLDLGKAAEESNGHAYGDLHLLSIVQWPVKAVSQSVSRRNMVDNKRVSY